jgi:hypothetical protein
MKPADDIKKFFKNAAIDTNAKMDEIVLNKVITTHEKTTNTNSATTKPSIRRIIMKSPITKIAAAVVIIIAVSIGVNQFGGSVTSVAWADVTERFESVPFFNLTIYVGDDSSQEAKKIQIWKSEDSRVRAYDGNVTICADLKNRKGKMTASTRNFTVKSNDPIVKWITFDPNTSLAKIFLDTLGTEGQFSLDTLIKSFPPNVSEITPVATADTVASKEIIVFKAKSETTPEHLTIWALRESKLPVQMQFRDPRNGEYGDFFFDYSEQKDAKFFDPNAFTHQ